MTARAPDPFRALAAATTPVVAAALFTIGLLASGCRAPAPPLPSGPAPGAPTARTFPSPGSGVATGAVLLVATGTPAAPLVVAHRPDLPGAPGAPVLLPPDLDALAVLAGAPGGSLGVLAADGRGWLAARNVDGSIAAWGALPPVPPAADPPGPILGGTWTAAGDALLVLAGSPGSGTRRTGVAELPLRGAGRWTASLEIEPDGPGVAALPDGLVGFVGRDRLDRGVVMVASAPGAVSVTDIPARTIAAGGNLVAVGDGAAVRVGSAADLAAGNAPTDVLPLDGDLGAGAIAVAPDGGAVAVVRLDDDGLPVRVDVLVARDGRWEPRPPIPLPARPGGIAMTWLADLP